jgi:hypothetical protein
MKMQNADYKALAMKMLIKQIKFYRRTVEDSKGRKPSVVRHEAFTLIKRAMIKKLVSFY